jgi:aminoglycoside 3-N-acetyltransferase I
VSYSIHRLGAGDAALMAEMNAMFGAEFGDPASYGEAPPGGDYLSQILARDHVIALAAIRESAVVGGLVAYGLDKLEQRRREIYLYDLAVVEAHRRRGIARALITELRHIAYETGSWAVFVQADYGDDPAIALYQGLGMREAVLHFDLTPLPR